MLLVTPLLALATAETAGVAFGHALRLTPLLTGLLSFCVGGGIARGASDGVHLGRSGRIILLRGASEMAAAGMLLAIVMRVAYGAPEQPRAWLGFVLAGALAAVPAGVAVAALTSLRVRRKLARAKQPRAAAAPHAEAVS